MTTISTGDVSVWKTVDPNTQTKQVGDRVVPDHAASTAADLQAAKKSVEGLPGLWQDVFEGKSVVGGANPKDCVAKANTPWEKMSTNVLENGSNAVFAGGFTVMSLLEGALNGLRGLAHWVSERFESPKDSTKAKPV